MTALTRYDPGESIGRNRLYGIPPSAYWTMSQVFEATGGILHFSCLHLISLRVDTDRQELFRSSVISGGNKTRPDMEVPPVVLVKKKIKYLIRSGYSLIY